MDRVSRLLEKVKPTVHGILQKDNQYLGLSYEELKAYRRPDSRKTLPEVGTVEHTKYIYAVVQARADRKR